MNKLTPGQPPAQKKQLTSVIEQLAGNGGFRKQKDTTTKEDKDILMSDLFKEKVEKIAESSKPKTVARAIAGPDMSDKLAAPIQEAPIEMKKMIGSKKSKEESKVGNVSTAFFSTVAKGTKIKTNESVTDVMVKLVSFLEKAHEEKVTQYELSHDFEKTLNEKEEERHKKLLDAVKQAMSVKKAPPEKEPIVEKKKASVKKPKETAIKAPPPEPKPSITSRIVSAAGEAAGTVATMSAGEIAVAVGGTAVAVGGTAMLGKLIAEKGESGKAGYNAANMGTKKVDGKDKIMSAGKVNLEDMTIGEIMRRQSIKWGSPDEKDKLFAVGKYQIIPGTLNDAVKTLRLDTKAKFNANTQEKIFNDYLLKVRKPHLQAYLSSKTDDPTLLMSAIHELSLEWASIADPNIPGGKSSHYGNGNKALISVEEMSKTLQAQRLQNSSTVDTTPKVPGERLQDASIKNQEIKPKGKSNTNLVVDNTVTSIIKPANPPAIAVTKKDTQDLPMFMSAY